MSIESPPALNRLDHIQALRGIAALMVVMSHLFIIEQKYSADQILGDWAIYGMAGVDLFFVISGFIMVYVMWDRPRGAKAAGEFVWGRASRIYPLYWIVSLVLLALWFVRPDLVFSSIDTPPDILKSFALFPNDREPLLAVGWTLVHEMYFYLVFTLIVLLPRKALLPCLVIWFLALVILRNQFYGSLDTGQSVLKLVLSAMTYQFMAGAFYAAMWKIGISRNVKTATPKAQALGNSLLIIMGLIWFAWTVIDFQNFPYDESRGGHLATPIALIVLGFVMRDDRGHKVWTPLVTLGDWSYSLYLTHVLSLTVMGRVWANFRSESWIDNVLVLLIMIAATIAVSGLVYNYIERPIIKTARNTRERLFN